LQVIGVAVGWQDWTNKNAAVPAADLLILDAFIKLHAHHFPRQRKQ
jgi:hypothetical protein